jgi:hypothetical protein
MGQEKDPGDRIHQGNLPTLADPGDVPHSRSDKELAGGNRETSAFCTNNAILEHKQFEKE